METVCFGRPGCPWAWWGYVASGVRAVVVPLMPWQGRSLRDTSNLIQRALPSSEVFLFHARDHSGALGVRSPPSAQTGARHSAAPLLNTAFSSAFLGPEQMALGLARLFPLLKLELRASLALGGLSVAHHGCQLGGYVQMPCWCLPLDLRMSPGSEAACHREVGQWREPMWSPVTLSLPEGEEGPSVP